jgi:hypothetical protein
MVVVVVVVVIFTVLFFRVSGVGRELTTKLEKYTICSPMCLYENCIMHSQ